MLISASPEFIALCRSQVALLAQTLGASLGVVYLTHQMVEGGETQLVPVFAYPDTAVAWQDGEGWALPSAEIQTVSAVPSLSMEAAPPDLMTTLHLRSELSTDADVQFTVEPPNHRLSQPRQIVVPLMHEEGMLGFLVTGRDDRAWTDWEHTQVERIAETLAIACVLDQRYQWLEQAHHQQERLQARQRDLMDNLLHQFRSPLTALKTFGKLLLKRLLPGDVNREIASSIIRESDRLNELLQQLDQAADLGSTQSAYILPESKASSSEGNNQSLASLPPTNPRILLPATGLSSNGDFPIVAYPLADCLESLLASAMAIAQERGLRLNTHMPTNLPLVLVNPLALREVLSNLLDNALKYTPSGGEVFFQVAAPRQTEFGAQQIIDISDTGPGIPPQDLEHLFERHYRGVQAKGEIPGTGLGLAIARALVQQMQGDIQVFSPALPEAIGKKTSLNSGTTFRVWLPISPQT
jgi:signal transduction histidine kinase